MGGLLEYFLVPNVFPSSSRKVPQDVPNSTKLLFIVYALAKVELSYINYKVEPKGKHICASIYVMEQFVLGLCINHL